MEWFQDKMATYGRQEKDPAKIAKSLILLARPAGFEPVCYPWDWGQTLLWFNLLLKFPPQTFPVHNPQIRDARPYALSKSKIGRKGKETLCLLGRLIFPKKNLFSATKIKLIGGFWECCRNSLWFLICWYDLRFNTCVVWEDIKPNANQKLWQSSQVIINYPDGIY